ncbi:MAG: 4Fe-4S binding protein [Anaerotignum sp.]
MKKLAIISTADCVACGSCQKVCPKNAITIHNGIAAKVDNTLCVGCGMCSKSCPADIICIKEVDLLG